jgi:hypothetical protein
MRRGEGSKNCPKLRASFNQKLRKLHIKEYFFSKDFYNMNFSFRLKDFCFCQKIPIHNRRQINDELIINDFCLC